MPEKNHLPLLSFVVFGLFVFNAVVLHSVTFARSIFEIEATVGGITQTESFDNVFDFIEGLESGNFDNRFPNYNDNSAATALLDWRGVDVIGKFKKNSTLFSLDIPSIDVHERFKGATRDDSIDMLEDWFKEDGGSVISALMKELVEETPNDPVAGNPNSLMASLVGTNYGSAFDTCMEIESRSEESKSAETEEEGAEPKKTTYSNLVSIAPRFGSLRQGDLDSRHVTLPISYAIRFNRDPRYQLKFDFPITWTEVDGANSYAAGLGVGFTFPVMDHWYLTPGVSYGAVGSYDLGALAQVVSGSLTSVKYFYIGKYKLAIGNMGGYYQTLQFPFEFGGFDTSTFDPEVENYVFRNGIMVTIPTERIVQNTSLDLFFTDTRYFGDELYIDNYEEVGFSYGYSKHMSKTLKDKLKHYFRDLRGGITYLFADESHGFTANFGYSF